MNRSLFLGLAIAGLVAAAVAVGWLIGAQSGLSATQRAEVRAVVAQELQNGNGSQATASDADIRAFILENPEVLVESLGTWQERAAEEERNRASKTLAERRDAIESDPTSPVIGNPEGSVTVVEFTDYRCGYCKQVFPAVMELIEADGDIRYVIKEFPILSEESVLAARMALAVWQIAPETYFDYHAALMGAKGALTRKRLLDIATEVGAPAEKVAAHAEDIPVQAAIADVHALARDLGIKGTPAFVIGGKLIPGAVSVERLQGLVAEARENRG